jgi:DNA replication protein DnaC
MPNALVLWRRRHPRTGYFLLRRLDGKSHIVTALGVRAVEHQRKKVRFFATVDLVNVLEQEKTMNKAAQLAERLLRLDLVILDELGYPRRQNEARMAATSSVAS